MIQFICGLILGGITGIGLMCLLIASRGDL